MRQIVENLKSPVAVAAIVMLFLIIHPCLLQAVSEDILSVKAYPTKAYLNYHKKVCIDIFTNKKGTEPHSVKLVNPPFPVNKNIVTYKTASGKRHYCSCVNIPHGAIPGIYGITVNAEFRNGKKIQGKTNIIIAEKKSAKSQDILSPETSKQIEKYYTSPVINGNRIIVLDDGEKAFNLYRDAIKSAHKSIYLQTFLIERKGRSKEIYELIKDKAKKGVDVKIILTRYSQIGMSPDVFIDLKRNNVNVIMIGDISFPSERSIRLNPWRKLLNDQMNLFKKLPNQVSFTKWISRNGENNHSIEYSLHEKYLVIDGAKAFAGGRNIADNYFFWWKDMDVYLEGPVVKLFYNEFRLNWKEFGGESLPEIKALAQTMAGIPVSIAVSKPWEGNFTTVDMLCSAINMSQDTVYISSQYLALPDNTRKALINAAARGVDVRILTNSYETGLEVAFSLCHYISLNYYAELLQSGVRIYEYKCSEDLEKKPYYHAKYFIIDGKWTSIGSFNLSVRSAYIESELQVNIPDCQRAFENLPNVGVKNLPLLHLGFIILLFLPLRACL